MWKWECNRGFLEYSQRSWSPGKWQLQQIGMKYQMWIRGMLSKTREWIENLYKEQLVASLSHSGRVYGCKISTLMAWVQMALLFRSQMSPLKWSPALKTNSPFSYLKAKPISETPPQKKKNTKKLYYHFQMLSNI